MTALAAPRTATPPSARPPVAASTVFVALMRRDLRVARRELPFFLLRTVMQPLLFIVVFGYLLPKMGFLRAGYTTAGSDVTEGLTGVSMGGGLAWRHFGFDMAWVPYGALGNTFRYALLVKF